MLIDADKPLAEQNNGVRNIMNHSVNGRARSLFSRAYGLISVQWFDTRIGNVSVDACEGDTIIPMQSDGGPGVIFVESKKRGKRRKWVFLKVYS